MPHQQIELQSIYYDFVKLIAIIDKHSQVHTHYFPIVLLLFYYYFTISLLLVVILYYFVSILLFLLLFLLFFHIIANAIHCIPIIWIILRCRCQYCESLPAQILDLCTELWLTISSQDRLCVGTVCMMNIRNMGRCTAAVSTLLWSLCVLFCHDIYNSYTISIETY